jgi:hypothetical protein
MSRSFTEQFLRGACVGGRGPSHRRQPDINPLGGRTSPAVRCWGACPVDEAARQARCTDSDRIDAATCSSTGRTRPCQRSRSTTPHCRSPAGKPPQTSPSLLIESKDAVGHDGTNPGAISRPPEVGMQSGCQPRCRSEEVLDARMALEPAQHQHDFAFALCWPLLLHRSRTAAGSASCRIGIQAPASCGATSPILRRSPCLTSARRTPNPSPQPISRRPRRPIDAHP